MTAQTTVNRYDERKRLLDSDESTEDSCNIDEELIFSSSSSTTLCASTIKPSSFPWRAVTVILMLTAVRPLIFQLVFPFINQMVLEIGVVDDPERVGFYSGIIESLFAVMSFLFVMPFSFLSDRYGRKPVVLISVTVLALSTTLFGFSKSYWFMITTRAMEGVSAASFNTMKVMLGELTDRSNQGKAFSALADRAAFKVGQILGQPIGGLLSHPKRNSSMFNNEFWKTYPYAFPCLFSASLALLAVVAGIFTLNETKPKISRKKGKQSHYGTLASDDIEGLSTRTKPTASQSSVLTPHVTSVFTSLFAMSTASMSLFALYPLFAFTPVEYGGLGCNEATIGAHMAVRSTTSILLLSFFAPVQSRIGTLRTYQISVLIWPIATLFFPVLNILNRWDVSAVLMDAALCAFFVVWGLANLSWLASSVLINDTAPSADSLAAMNGLSQMATILPEAIAPVCVTSMFAWSITSDFLGGYLIWIILLSIISIASLHCLTLTEATHDWREDCKN